MSDSPGFSERARPLPLAYFLTFTCYGTWLHGDARGSVDRHHRAYGSPSVVPNPALARFDRGWQRGAPVQLDRQGRTAVDSAIRATCVANGWEVRGLNVRTNHIHVVVTANRPPEMVMTALKAWSTRRLRELGIISETGRVLTRHGSTRYLWTEAEVERACLYVAEGQGPGLLDS